MTNRPVESSARTVADIMRRDVVTITPDASIRELAAVLARHGISGVPVVEADGRVVGLASSADMIWLIDRFLSEEPARGRRNFFAWPTLDRQTVGEIMTPDVFSVEADLSIDELLRYFTRTGVRRALVMDAGELVGVVSISDVLGLIARGGTTRRSPDPAAEPDQEE